MIPAQFDYLTPKTIDEAVGLLAQHVDEAKVLAGGHSLIPAMKLRLAMPQVLIDIGRIRDLAYIREESGQIRIGAMTTHYQLESSDRLREICPLLPECAALIGDVQVRNKGTIGGSLAHSDPAGDWPAAIIALGAEIVAVSAGGERTIPATDFCRYAYNSARAREILREIRITTERPVRPVVRKVPQPASGFAVVGVAVNLTRDANGKCQSAYAALPALHRKYIGRAQLNRRSPEAIWTSEP
jgi:carbon-monoxide dehydrogenase medium subunit